MHLPAVAICYFVNSRPVWCVFCVLCDSKPLQYTLSNLLPDSTYQIRVRAVSYSNGGGGSTGNTYSEWGGVASITTNTAGACGNSKDVGAMQKTKVRSDVV